MTEIINNGITFEPHVSGDAVVHAWGLTPGTDLITIQQLSSILNFDNINGHRS